MNCFLAIYYHLEILCLLLSFSEDYIKNYLFLLQQFKVGSYVVNMWIFQLLIYVANGLLLVFYDEIPSINSIWQVAN